MKQVVTCTVKYAEKHFLNKVNKKFHFSFSWQIHRVSKKLCQCYFLNNSVKHWPILIIFSIQHKEET